MGRPTRYSVAGVGIPRGGMAWVRLSAAGSRGAGDAGPDGIFGIGRPDAADTGLHFGGVNDGIIFQLGAGDEVQVVGDEREVILDEEAANFGVGAARGGEGMAAGSTQHTVRDT